MVELEKPAEDETLAESEKPAEVSGGEGEPEPKPEPKAGCRCCSTKTLTSFLILIAALVLAYLAVTFLMGSDYNLDTLLTGSKATRLP